ncbi:hypothetical protein [Sphingomonas sp. BK036]|uniref:hypothetical protein n=1 Tax=Sphingomonas sp. BK036 TaxID=2512122 RepID=UPI001029A0B2|nr:hypothetical protein [Sphingomonas sp. BK036]
MDGDIITRMRVEEADLSRKLKAVRDLLAAYGQGDPANNVSLPFAAAVSTAANVRPTSSPTGSREKASIEGFGSYGKRIVSTAMSVMLMSSGPVKTRDIVEFLEAMNVEITGENKVNAVGALLSRSADITSHGKSGWTVADDVKAHAIVSEYAYKENAPSSEFDELLGGAETAPHALEWRPQE